MNTPGEVIAGTVMTIVGVAALVSLVLAAAGNWWRERKGKGGR